MKPGGTSGQPDEQELEAFLNKVAERLGTVFSNPVNLRSD